jgi:hypothetical protein
VSIFDLLPLLVRVIVDPGQPHPALTDRSHHNEVVAVGGWTLNPKFEAEILKFQEVVNLNLIEPLLVDLSISLLVR